MILDVGGKKFAASKSTLLNMQDSFFTVMLCSDRWKPNDDGAYFIDRNPKFFGRILEYLRTGTLRVNDLHFEQMAGYEQREEEGRTGSLLIYFRLKEEFDFYQIAMPLLPLTFVSTYGFTSTNNNTTVSRNISGHLGIRANKELEPGGTYEWTIRLECIPPTPSHWICIGVAGVDAMDCHSMFGVSSANCVYPGGVRVPGISGDWRTGDLIHVVYKNATVTIENKRTSKGISSLLPSTSVLPLFPLSTSSLPLSPF